MSKKMFVVLVVLAVLSIFASYSFAMCGSCGMESKAQGPAEDTAASGGAQEKVNNKICPVTGEAVDPANPVTVEHNGKVYNLCCGSCVDAFKKSPEKYAAKVQSRTTEEAPGEGGHTHNH